MMIGAGGDSEQSEQQQLKSIHVFLLTKQNVSSPNLMNDLFGVVPFLRHGSDLLSWLFTTFDLDQEFQARSSSLLSLGLRSGPRESRPGHHYFLRSLQ
jgi:hypothetical protein